MDRNEIILAAMAAGNRDNYSPVQVQKLLFLIDRNVAEHINNGQSFFDFQPYDYGPFDKSVYDELRNLVASGDVEIIFNGRWNEYRLTEKGQKKGNKLLEELPNYIKDYFYEVSKFVRSLSFTELVSSIYNAYPEMKANSVFQDKS